MKELSHAKIYCVENLLNINYYDLKKFHCFTYGVYSIHSYMFKPKIRFPDLRLSQLIYNYNNLNMYPLCLTIK